MTSHASSTRMDPAFSEFLFAPIREENNGMMLSVISGLTRLDLDPWSEAARLAALPRALAAQTLAPIIGRLAEGGGEVFDARKIADRLIGLLPSNAASQSTKSAGREASGAAYLPIAILALCLLVGAFVFFGATRRDPPANDSAPAAAEPATVSPPLSSK